MCVISRQPYWLKVYVLEILKKIVRKWFFFLWRKVYILLIQKSKNKACHRTTFYSIFNMSSFRKPEIHNDLPKITKIKWIYYFFKQKSLTMFISSCCNNYLIEFKKKGKLTKFKVTPPTGFKPTIPGFEATEHLRNWMCKENCPKFL